MKTLLIDNYDSFTYNLYQLIGEVNQEAPIVMCNDACSWDELAGVDFDNIVVSPGPGRPDVDSDFGLSRQAILHSQVPLLGVCLGHQGLAHFYGGEIDYSVQVMHGRVSQIFHSGHDLFQGIPSPFMTVRYHSLHVLKVSSQLTELAWTSDGNIMALGHVSKPLWGVQFHPESVRSEYGCQLVRNFNTLTLARGERLIRNKRSTRKANAHNNIQIASSASTQGQQEPPAWRGKYRLYSRRLSLFLNPEDVFVAQFADSEPAFWLDSALLPSPERKGVRFSYMGDATGPHAEYLTYCLADKTTCVTRNGEVEIVRGNFFEYLEQKLQERYLPNTDLPFDFNLGYVGLLGYEMKAEVSGAQTHKAESPDAAFVFADRMIVFDHQEQYVYLVCLDEEENAERAVNWMQEIECKLSTTPGASAVILNSRPASIPWKFRHPNEAYRKLIAAAKNEIRNGESYEICLTNTISAKVNIDPLNAYRRLREVNSAPYASYFRLPELCVMSSSPELFFRIDTQGVIEAKPIKGTRRRGRSPEEDGRLSEDLRTCEKDRSENLMIVDLLRNDIGQVAEIGSVSVADMFSVETYQTVHQLVSTVRGRLRPDISALTCVKTAFPGGSMTGAPKKRTLQIIDKLEASARGVYSGAIGFFGLNGSAHLCIVIRAMVLIDDALSIGAGGAIVDLSEVELEMEEMLLKTEALITVVEETALPQSKEPIEYDRAG